MGLNLGITPKHQAMVPLIEKSFRELEVKRR